MKIPSFNHIKTQGLSLSDHVAALGPGEAKVAEYLCVPHYGAMQEPTLEQTRAALTYTLLHMALMDYRKKRIAEV